MLYLYTDPADPASRTFLFHAPTHTLAEHFITPTRTHHLRIYQEGDLSTDAMISFTDWLQAHDGSEQIRLSVMAGGTLPQLPEHLILASASTPRSLLIHYPALGFSAGLCEDGTKIPPHWKNPALLTPPQRSYLLAHAAQTLMEAIASHARRQAT
jgi:hypothetical protein